MPSEPSSRRRGRGRGSPANPQPVQRRGRGPPANPQPAQSSSAAQAGSYPLYASSTSAQSSSAAQAGSYPLYASTSAQLSTAAQARSYAPMSATHDWPYAPVFTPSSAPVFAPKSEHAPPPTPYAHFSKMIDKYLPDCPPAYTSSSPTCMEEDMSQPPLAHTVQKLHHLLACAGLSQVDSIVKRVRYYPDGTKKRGSEVKDKRRDKYYQLARALVDKYNDHHNLFGDLAYEVKDFLHGKPLWEDYYIHWTYFHMNFTAKAKGSYGVDTGNLFFAEVKYTRGDDGLTVNSCCILEPSDHGLCYGCGAGMKHPNDGNAYACGRRNISYRFQNGAPELPPGYCNDHYYEDSDEEVERLRSQFKEDEGGLKPLPMPLVV